MRFSKALAILFVGLGLAAGAHAQVGGAVNYGGGSSSGGGATLPNPCMVYGTSGTGGRCATSADLVTLLGFTPQVQLSSLSGNGMTCSGYSTATLTCTITYPVPSVFGRTGAVVAATSDYSFPQISGTCSLAQGCTGTTTGYAASIPGSVISSAVANATLAATATALASVGTQCSGNGSLATGVTAAGNANCHTLVAADIPNPLPPTGLIGDWNMNEGSGTALVDSTGITGNGTLGTSTAAPTWVAAGVAGSYVMRFTTATTSGPGQYVTMPAGLNTAATIGFMVQLPYINQYGTESNSPTNPSILCSTTTTPKTCIYFGGPTGFFTNLITSYNTGPSCGAPIQAGWHSIIWALGSAGDSTFDNVYIDGHPCYLTTTNTRYRNAQTVAWQLGGSTALTATWWNSQMSEVVAYSTYATASAAVAISNAMWSKLNAKGVVTTPAIPQTILNQLVVDGDSRDNGFGSVPVTNYVTGLSNTYAITNKAISGASATDNCAGYSQYAMQYFAPNAPKNIYIFGPAAANDFKDSSGSGLQFAELSYACVAQRNWANGYRTILMGEVSSDYNTPNDTNVQALNQWLQTNWQNVNSTYYVDTGADVDLGCAGCYSSSAASNLGTGFFISNIHWQTAAQQIVGALMSCAVNSLDGTTAANPGSYTSAAVSLGCGDNYTTFNTTSNSIVATLPSCVPFVGRSKSMVNITTSGANTLTFASQFPAGVSTTLSAAITTTTQSSITVTSATGFPAAAPFNIIIGSETLYVTVVSGTTWTVYRGVSASTAATATNGATVTLVSQPIVGATTLANGVAATFVGHRLSQTAGGCYWTVTP